MKRIKSMRAWVCIEKYTCKRHHECKPYGLPSCRPVRVYPDKVARLMERAARFCEEDWTTVTESWRKQWAKLNEEGRT